MPEMFLTMLVLEMAMPYSGFVKRIDNVRLASPVSRPGLVEGCRLISVPTSSFTCVQSALSVLLQLTQRDTRLMLDLTPLIIGFHILKCESNRKFRFITFLFIYL